MATKHICDGCTKEFNNETYLNTISIAVKDQPILRSDMGEFCNSCVERIKHFMQLSLLQVKQG